MDNGPTTNDHGSHAHVSTMAAGGRRFVVSAAFRRLLREPLLHFLLLGALIFGVMAEDEAPDAADARDRIVISGPEVERMSAAWAQRWQRPPNDAELAGMISEAVREQVLYREALALGLDRDDVVVRRHLRQKYEFLTQDLAYDTDPDDATLRAHYDAHAERYTQSTRISFYHILFSPSRRGPKAEADAAETLADLQWATGPEAAETLGDPTSLPSGFVAPDVQEIGAIFGPDFATALQKIEPGHWSGPVSSDYGLHLVWISERTPGRSLPFEDVRQRVKDDWVYQQRVTANEAVYRKLLERYDVVVEPSGAPGATAGSGS
ncbi:MAG: peptidylprolyl isomerase [Gemmobacter sp.]